MSQESCEPSAEDPVAMRAAGTGDPDAAEVAFESVFDSVATLFRETGSILHQLIGLEFRSGRAHDAHIEIVKAPERVPVLIARMRRRWGAVAHVRLAQNLPGNIAGLPHPERRTQAIIEIHVGNTVATAYCRVNKQTPEMARGLLVRMDASAA